MATTTRNAKFGLRGTAVYTAATLLGFSGLAAFAQGNDLPAVLSHVGWLAIAALVLGACSALLKTPFSLIGMLVVFFLAGFIGSRTGYAPITLMLLVLGGFFSGLGVYSIVVQLRQRRISSRKSEESAPDGPAER